MSLVLFLTPPVLTYLLYISSQMPGPCVPAWRGYRAWGASIMCVAPQCVCIVMPTAEEGSLWAQVYCRPQVDPGALLLSYSCGPLPRWRLISEMGIGIVFSILRVLLTRSHRWLSLPSHILTCGQGMLLRKEAVFPPLRWRHVPKKSLAACSLWVCQ